MSRRKFVGSTAGTLAAAAGLGSLLAACSRDGNGLLTSPISLRESRVPASGDVAPLPIPSISPNTGAHVWAPFPITDPPVPGVDPPDAEPITITNFNGSVGLAYISGMVTRRDRSGGTTRLPFVAADMRFMKGLYRVNDGRVLRGTFGLI